MESLITATPAQKATILSSVYVANNAMYRKVDRQAGNNQAKSHVDMVKGQDAEGFSCVYDSYSGSLFNVISRIIEDRSTAEDLLQDTFVKIWANIHQYDESKSSFFTWMLNIARNGCIDHLRTKKYKNLKSTSFGDQYFSAEVSNARKINHDTIGLKNIVNRLDDKYRCVINAIYFYGCSYDEAALMLDLPVGTVKTRARRGLGLLKMQLD